MDRQQILKKINDIHRELQKDQHRIMIDKIHQRHFHLHQSNRGFLMRKMIHFFRSKLKNEIELIIQPVLDNQKDINLRFLHEIQSLKNQICQQTQTSKGRGDEEEKNSTNSEKPFQ